MVLMCVAEQHHEQLLSDRRDVAGLTATMPKYADTVIQTARAFQLWDIDPRDRIYIDPEDADPEYEPLHIECPAHMLSKPRRFSYANLACVSTCFAERLRRSRIVAQELRWLHGSWGTFTECDMASWAQALEGAGELVKLQLHQGITGTVLHALASELRKFQGALDQEEALIVQEKPFDLADLQLRYVS